MDKIAMLIAEGANELSIPCMWFCSLADGVNFVSKFLGEPTTWTPDKAIWNWKTVEKGFKIPDGVDFNGFDWKAFREKSPECKSEILGNAYRLFTSYYDGCGGVGTITLTMVSSATPFVAWNLD